MKVNCHEWFYAQYVLILLKAAIFPFQAASLYSLHRGVSYSTFHRADLPLLRSGASGRAGWLPVRALSTRSAVPGERALAGLRRGTVASLLCFNCWRKFPGYEIKGVLPEPRQGVLADDSRAGNAVAGIIVSRWPLGWKCPGSVYLLKDCVLDTVPGDSSQAQ